MSFLIILLISFYLFNRYVTYLSFLNSTDSSIIMELNNVDNAVDKYIPIKYLGKYEFSTPSNIFCKTSQIKRGGADNINHLISVINDRNIYLIEQNIPAPSFLNCSGITGKTNIIIFKK